MAENALSPAFVKLNYHSLYSTHVQIIPSVPYLLPDVGNITGRFQLRGAALPTPAGDAIEDFVNLQMPFFPESVVFDNYTIFTQADEDAPPTPQYAGNLGISGTNDDAGWSKAVQATWTFRTTAFGLFKLVMLDMASANDFNPVVAPSDAAYTDLIAYITSTNSWLSGRDDERPSTFLQISKTLNEKLRRSYKMN